MGLELTQLVAARHGPHASALVAQIHLEAVPGQLPRDGDRDDRALVADGRTETTGAPSDRTMPVIRCGRPDALNVSIARSTLS